MSHLVPMMIKGLMLDPASNSPIVVLKDDDEKFFLPIWVGIFEANAIALQLENITTPRPGTPSLKMASAVDDATASERLQRLFDLHEQHKRERLESYRGRVLPVLVEGPSKHDPEMLSGRTDDNWVVNFTGDLATPLGSMLGVRIDQAQHHTLRGEAVV